VRKTTLITKDELIKRFVVMRLETLSKEAKTPENLGRIKELTLIQVLTGKPEGV
jgi:hypothetical protein